MTNITFDDNLITGNDTIDAFKGKGDSTKYVQKRKLFGQFDNGELLWIIKIRITIPK